MELATWRVVLLGRPGAGKGVQGERLAQTLGVPHVSTGDLVRRLALDPSSTAPEVASMIADGELLPDELVFALVEAAVKPSRGVVLEGFPRSARQAAILEEAWLPHRIDLAILLDVSPNAATTRLAARRFCPACGTDVPSDVGTCPSCGGRDDIRIDDHVGVIGKRLWLHDREEPAVEGWFERRGMLVRVNGAGPVEDVFDRLLEAMRWAGYSNSPVTPPRGRCAGRSASPA